MSTDALDIMIQKNVNELCNVFSASFIFLKWEGV